MYLNVLATLSFINLRKKTIFENIVTYTDLFDRSSNYLHQFQNCLIWSCTKQQINDNNYIF